MSLSSSLAFSLRRASLRASSRLILMLVIGVIAIASVALFYEMRHDPSDTRIAKSTDKGMKDGGGGKKHKKKKNKGDKTPKTAVRVTVSDSVLV